MNDPVLGIHVLTEFVFCPRAGLVEYAKNEDDRGEDPLPVRWDYIPRYDLRRLRREANRQFRLLWLQLGAIVSAAVLFWWLLDRGPFLWVTGVLGISTLLGTVTRTIRRLSGIEAELRKAERARPRVPNPDSEDDQAMNWWELLQAGFVSRRFDAVLHDEELNLSGRPWRVLADGDVRIPVFRQHAETGQLHRQHYVRMAAYCALIENCTGLSSPYGIVLFGQSHDGVAVANSRRNAAIFQSELRKAREVIRLSSEENDDPSPPPESRCAGCHHGQPVPIAHYGNRPFVVRGNDRTRYHTDCGDRFQWVPPHRDSRTLELRPVKR